MKLADGWLLLKKILVGLAVTVAPLVIIAGGLWGVQRVPPTVHKPNPILRPR